MEKDYVADKSAGRLYIKAEEVTDIRNLFDELAAVSDNTDYKEIRIIPKGKGRFSVCVYGIKDFNSFTTAPCTDAVNLAPVKDIIVDDSNPMEARIQRDGLKGLFNVVKMYRGVGTETDQEIMCAVNKFINILPDPDNTDVSSIIRIMIDAGINSAKQIDSKTEEEKREYLETYINRIKNVFG